MPNKAQLISVIDKGDDSLDNVLILNKSELFELRNLDSLSDAHVDPDIVALNETFFHGNGYVGTAASLHTDFIDTVFEQMSNAWKRHQETGETGLHVPDFNN